MFRELESKGTVFSLFYLLSVYLVPDTNLGARYTTISKREKKNPVLILMSLKKLH